MGATAFWNRGVPTENAKFEKLSKIQKSQNPPLENPPLWSPEPGLASSAATGRSSQHTAGKRASHHKAKRASEATHSEQAIRCSHGGIEIHGFGLFFHLLGKNSAWGGAPGLSFGLSILIFCEESDGSDGVLEQRGAD